MVERRMDKSTQIQLEEIRETDILIGIPSYNNVQSIGHVVRAVTAALPNTFQSQRQ